MLARQIKRLINDYGFWRLAHIALAAAASMLAGLALLGLALPLRSGSGTVDVSSDVSGITAGHLSEILQPETPTWQQLSKVIRPGLFKASTPLRDKPMADKTIERIKSQLKLQCIMEMNGEPVAYVHIKGTGLKKCKVGDSVSDLFTVLNIDKRSIEITIIDHKVTLSL